MLVKIDKTSPKLIASTPKAGGSAINPHQDITLVFDEPVKSGTGSIVISNGKDIHKIAITDAQVKISNKTITINPIADLLPNSHYTVSVSATAIQDVVGNKFSGKSFTFDTVDTIAPVLKTTNPTNGSKLVSINRDISFTFNEKIKLGDGNIILSNGTDVLKISVNDPQVSVSGTKLTFNPIHDFVSGSSYTVKLETNAVKDLAGNAFTENGDGFKFYTKAEMIVDKTAPLLMQTTPNDNATSVLVNTDLKLVFNETIRAGAGDIVISNGKDIRTISIADKSQVTINGNTVNINPKADLLAGGNYNVQLSTGVILDKAGNTFAGISNATTFDFTTKAAVVPVLTTGKAIDGYLSGSDVFADENGDGIQNAGEASAKTDKSGNFTLTNAKGTLHISGGIDLSTGKAFKGVLKAPEGSSVVTPLTTVQQGFIDAGQTPAQAQKSIATAFGFDTNKVDLTKYDPISELVNASITGKTDPVAVQMMANTAKIANFLVTASEILQGAAGVDTSSKTNNLSIQSASDALINALVTAVENKAKTSDSKVDLADSELLKTVLITSSENSHTDKNFTPTESADYQSKISKMADTVSVILKDAADNITTAVNTGGNALTLLTNMAKVTAFTQGNIGSSLQTFAQTFDPNSTNAISVLKAQETALTGTVADTSAANIVVTPFSGVSTNFVPPVAPPITVNPPVAPPVTPPTTVTPPVTVPVTPPTTNTPPPVTPPTTAIVPPPFDNSGSSSTPAAPAPVAPKSILTYTPSTLVETSANDGSVATTVTLSLMTLTGDAFKGTNGQALTGAVVTNVPTGLTATVTKVNNTTATLTLTGKAVAHANSNDMSNLTVTLGNTSFIGGNASNVIGATKPNLSIDFNDSPTITYSTTTFAEATANDGSIATTATLTLTGDTFKGTIGQAVTGAAITNVPIGLTASLIKATDTTATLTLTGKAVTHANAQDVSNLTVSLSDTSFANNKAVSVVGSTKNNLVIDFADAVPRTITYSPAPTITTPTTLAESTVNDGSISTAVTLTLTGDTFTGTIGQELSGATFSNVPQGLTAKLTKASATTATLTLSGNATAHANINDVSNFTVALNDNAFSSGNATGITGTTKNDLKIHFTDTIVKTLTYSSTVLTEAVANDGSIANSITLTLVGDTFSGSNGQLAGATVTNVPIGLNAVVTRTGDDGHTATLTLTGKAAAHDNSQDISNLTVTLANNSFMGGNASAVTGATNNAIKVDFADIGTIQTGTTGADVLFGAELNDIIYGGGGTDIINGRAGRDTIDITDDSSASAKIIVAAKNQGVDTVIGFKGSATINNVPAIGGDVLDFSSIVANLSKSVATGVTLTGNLAANNVFIFTSTPVSITDAAARIASDNNVSATNGYIVIANSQNNNAVTVYHSADLDKNGATTELVVLSGTSINTLTADNFLI